MTRLLIFGSIATFALVIGCSPVNFEKGEGPRCQGFNESCISQNGIDYFDYTIQTPAPNTKTDILVVDDNSLSMVPEQTAMGDRFVNFINSISSLDWRLGIVTTDIQGTSLPTQDGKLLEFESSPGVMTGLFVLTKSTQNKDNLFRQTVRREETGSGDERGIYAAIRALDRRNERSFLRDDAHLAVIVLSDENERSNGGGMAGRPMESGKDYAEDLINYVQNTWNGNKSLTVHSIIVKEGDSTCLNQQTQQAYATAYYGLEYAKASSLTGGIIGNVCASDYGAQLSAMGDVQVELVSSVNLACAPTSIVVDPNYGHSLVGNKVAFNPPLPAGTTVRLKYQCPSR